MTRFWALMALMLAGQAVWGAARAGPPKLGPPKLDKPRLEAYIRYAEGYTADVQFAIDDPVPSAFPGYFRVVAHLTKGHSRIDRVYYATRDGQHFIAGSIWDLKGSPFEDTLEHLPRDGPAFGPANAKVTIVVFSDFECPFCRELAKTLRDHLPQAYPNDVRVIFKDFPIESIHPWARAAAEASHCVDKQSTPGFWAFHDWIFAHQGEITVQNLREKVLGFAEDQDLNAEQLTACMDSRVMAPVVDASLRAGTGLQIEQTPTLFINGRIVGGAVSWEQVDSLIGLELKRPAQVPGPETARCCEVGVTKVTPKVVPKGTQSVVPKGTPK